MELIQAATIQETMETVVMPYIDSHKESGYFERVSGKKLYFEHIQAEEEKAEVILLHGFTEWIPKFYETVWYFTQLGCSVWLMEQVGHGFSYREVKDPSLVHIQSYESMVEDVDYFVKEIVNKGEEAKKPQILFGHSMGGGISALYLETHPEVFANAILNAPMMQISNGMPEWLAKFVSWLMKVLGKGTSYIPGGKPFDPTPSFEDSCTNCPERYDFDLMRQTKEEAYHTCTPSMATAGEFLKITKEAVDPENVKKIRANVLLLQAEKDGTVLPGGQNRFMEALGEKGKKVVIKNARHEIYRCTDENLAVYWNEIQEFLKKIS